MIHYNIKLDLELDNKDYYYHVKKNKNGHLVRQKIYKKSKDAIFKTTDLSVANNMTSEIDLDSIVAKNQIKEKITQALTYLTPKEERVIRMRFGIGLNTDYTLEEVGLVFSVTRERIVQIQAKALRKLKHPNRTKHLKELLVA